MTVSIRFLGHSFFRLNFNSKTVLVDPYIKDSHPQPEYKRIEKSAFKERDLKNVDVILVSHEHFGHFDKELLEKLATENNACVLGHESVLKELNLSKRFVQSLDIGKTLSVRGLHIKGFSAHHPHSFYPMGFLIQGNGMSVYHMGDTQLLDDFDVQPDLALLPIGGNHTMDCVDAVRAVKSMKPKYAIPMHYNTFEPIKADPLEFKQKIEKSILKTIPAILKPGKTFRF
ncbi:metal-dependent hydrolase [Candidatus Micrarchaeota archaeon]|nr:metal-dependent hydrolase [Candidatus Micrarchaeota archaeon]MBU1930138.1 metal-dependent hydrolase [Candidatus Micrarchaeota archaeon]